MKINKYFLTLSFLIFALVLTGCAKSNDQENFSSVDKNSEIILFYSEKCSHCKIVEKYIIDNNIAEKVNFTQDEVYNNKGNATFMIEKQKECNLDKDMIGAVPFLWAKDKCFLGQDDIIQFFKDKVNEK
jgi:glutaredoxin